MRSALGLPNVAGRRAVLVASIIDSLGSGLFVPFAVLYFVRTSSLSLTTVGAALSIASAAVIAVTPLTGQVVDRFGAKRCVVAANVLQAIGFVGYLWVDAAWQLVAFALLAAAGRRLFWTANGAFVALISAPSDRTSWFALLRALRNGGFAFGGALAAITAAVGTTNAFHLLAIGNAASFVLAGLLVGSWRATAPTERARTPAVQRRAGYRGVVADRPFLLLVVASFLFVLCSLVVDVMLTIYVTGPLHRPAWLAGLLFTLNGLLVVAAQTVVTRRTGHHRPTRMLHLTTMLFVVAFLMLWALLAVPGALVVPGLLMAILAISAAQIICMPILNSLALGLAPTEQQGRYFAVQGLSWVGAQAIAPAAFTWLLTRGTGWLWLAMVAACAATTIVIARFSHTVPTDIDQPEHAPAP